MARCASRGWPPTRCWPSWTAGKQREPDVHGARLFGLVYPTGRDDLERLIADVNRRYLFGNALNPFKFAELAALEARGRLDDRASCCMLPEAGGGSMTSGGTESILMSMLVNRERARARGIERPQILARRVRAPRVRQGGALLRHGGRAGPARRQLPRRRRRGAELLSPATAVVVASAFNYPYGVMDPVDELAALAARHGAGCHVDACIGGFVLPFLERLGHDVPPWDFRVPGRHRDLRRRAQVRLLPEGRVGHPAPRCRLVRPPGVPLRPVAVGDVRLAGRRRRPAGRADRDRVGGDDLPRRSTGYVDIMRDPDRHRREGARGRSRHRRRSRSSAIPIGPVLAMRSDDDRPRTRSAT